MGFIEFLMRCFIIKKLKQFSRCHVPLPVYRAGQGVCGMSYIKNILYQKYPYVQKVNI
jgi:hypothetical protein